MSSTSPLVDKFSIWLFAGTGATGALYAKKGNYIPKSAK
jgi:hypothetical protein